MTKSDTIRAAILVAQHQPLTLGRLCVPEQLGFGQVLVEVHYASICGSQLGEMDGIKGEDPFLPHLLGHEGSGQVLKIGPGVTHVAEGEHVVLHWRKGAGLEGDVPAYSWEGQRVNAGRVTTFNERAVISENRLTRIPPDFDLVLATLLGCAVTTGFGVISNDARLRIGESLVVIGAGGVGLATVLAGSLMSANPIVVVDRFDCRLNRALRVGATHTVNTREGEWLATLMDIVGTQGADVVVETTGDTELIRIGYDMTHARGRSVLVGVSPMQKKVNINTEPLHFGKTLIGSHGGACRPGYDIPRYVALHRAGKLALNELIGEQYPLEEINTAIAQMRSGKVAGRCVIRMPAAERQKPVSSVVQPQLGAGTLS